MSDGFSLWPPPAPPLSYGEIMDRLFDLWCKSGDAQTFEEFINYAASSETP